jgi:hypothetical protein
MIFLTTDEQKRQEIGTNTGASPELLFTEYKNTRAEIGEIWNIPKKE